jgi:hypothetical protein
MIYLSFEHNNANLIQAATNSTMAKSRKNKNKEKSVTKASSEPPVEKNEKPFDFGGLPPRDLKKNLGCG